MKPGIIMWVAGLLICFAACTSTDDNNKYPCGSDNPTEEIPWLKEIKDILVMSEKMTGFQIIRYIYKGEYVFYIDASYNPDNVKAVYDCNGIIICEFGGPDGINTCPDFEAEATDSTMLFDYVQH